MTGEYLGGGEIFEVLVIGHYKNYVACTFQIQLPVLERFVYCEEFFVVYLVVEFCGNHGSRVEGDGVQVVVARRDLRKDSGNRVVGAISLYDYRVGWVEVSEDGNVVKACLRSSKAFWHSEPHLNGVSLCVRWFMGTTISE